MTFDSDPFQNVLRHLFPFLFSLLDDVLIVGLSRLGCHLPWLEWLSPVVIAGTAIYFTVQVIRSAFVAKVLKQCRAVMQDLVEA
jgi:hypothetical protein